MRWLAAQDPAAVFTTTINQAEILHGVEAFAAQQTADPIDLGN